MILESDHVYTIDVLDKSPLFKKVQSRYFSYVYVSSAGDINPSIEFFTSSRNNTWVPSTLFIRKDRESCCVGEFMKTVTSEDKADVMRVISSLENKEYT